MVVVEDVVVSAAEVDSTVVVAVVLTEVVEAAVDQWEDEVATEIGVDLTRWSKPTFKLRVITSFK